MNSDKIYEIILDHNLDRKNRITFVISSVHPDFIVKHIRNLKEFKIIEEGVYSYLDDDLIRTLFYISKDSDLLLDVFAKKVLSEKHEYRDIFSRALQQPNVGDPEITNIYIESKKWITVLKNFYKDIQQKSIKNLGYTDTENIDIL